MDVPILEVTRQIENARSHWQFNGKFRPPFAIDPKPHERSVWDFPRPPAIEEVTLPLRIQVQGKIVAETTRGRRVLETAGAPTYYFPPEDVIEKVSATGSRSLCEWKGVAEALSISGIENAAWRYVEMFAAFSELYRWVAFYPSTVDCYVGDERVTPQPGGYYGGWVTSDLVGPIKGGPGSTGW